MRAVDAAEEVEVLLDPPLLRQRFQLGLVHAVARHREAPAGMLADHPRDGFDQNVDALLMLEPRHGDDELLAIAQKRRAERRYFLGRIVRRGRHTEAEHLQLLLRHAADLLKILG